MRETRRPQISSHLQHAQKYYRTWDNIHSVEPGFLRKHWVTENAVLCQISKPDSICLYKNNTNAARVSDLEMPCCRFPMTKNSLKSKHVTEMYRFHSLSTWPFSELFKCYCCYFGFRRLLGSFFCTRCSKYSFVITNVPKPQQEWTITIWS